MRLLFLALLFNFWLFGEVIEQFHTDLVVVNNEKVIVKEKIRYNFESLSRHGIYLDIPKNQTILSNLKVSKSGSATPFKLFRKKDFYRIRIGDPNSYVGGVVDYKISFTLKGKIVRKYNNKHAIIFDSVGTHWEVPIKRAEGRVYLPKRLQHKVEVQGFRGKFGSKEPVAVQNDGTTLSFQADNLKPYEGITLLIQFNPSLMTLSKEPSLAYYKEPLYYLFLAPILALFYYFSKKYNFFGDIGSIAPRYRPPKDLTLLEAGLLKDNFVDFDEIKPTILELANLGYITIVTEDGQLFLKKEEKESSRLSEDQRVVYDAIFSVGDFVPNSEIKIEKPLFDKIKSYLHNSLVEKGYFGSKISTARQSFLFAAISAGLLTVGVFFYYIFRESGFEAFVPVAVSGFFIVTGIVNLIGGIRSRSFGTILFSVVWILFSLFFLATSIQSKDLIISIALMLAIIAIGTYMIYRQMNTLTFKGILAKRHLFGLREFIDKAEKDKIKFFLKEDSHYLDKLLPFAMLFGLNKHWLKLYEDLETPLPEWYNGDMGSFSHIDFTPSEFNPNSNSFDGFTPNDVSIDAGDFTDFGGFSGGGFGGGGGGSW